jgi:hypothetical protein
MIGAYRETVTLALDELRTRGVVRLGRRSIEISESERAGEARRRMNWAGA